MTQSELTHMAGAVDDSTINIIMGITNLVFVLLVQFFFYTET